MADVRSMLRNERASRRISHPHLTYSTTGTLICLVCHIQVKTEALWNKHLHSPQHATNAQNLRDDTSRKSTLAAAPSEESNWVSSSKKRKADDESSDEDSRKRTKGAQRVSPTDYSSEPFKRNEKPPEDSIKSIDSKASAIAAVDPDPTSNGILPHPPHVDAPPSTNQPSDPTATIDEDEWAAFQRDVATPPPEPSALTATADISAAPMTAAELAAQSREQASRQAKERSEAEVEGEKEDAARQLEEEFEDMAELEDRVRKLREKREKLRVQNREASTEDGDVKVMRPPHGVEKEYASDAGSSEDDEEDDWGGWGAPGRRFSVQAP
ncbi:MAG: hypothetical protein Q9225_000206 [Loekoesia sp. 1 TL-2023]